MSRVIFIALCSVCLLLIESTISLKCKTGIEQEENQFRKIVQMCKKQYTSNDNYSDDNSSSSRDEENNEEDSSSMDIFDTIFFSNSGSKSSNNFEQSWKDQTDNRNRGNNQRNSNSQHYSFNHTNENWRNGHPNHGDNNRDFNPNRSTKTSYSNRMHNNNNPKNYDKEQACAIQCFFNELNVVDQRGFPEPHLIIQLMTHNIRNPELQDFVEEAVIECFNYLNSDMNQEKCNFSQNLLTCLTDKGKERCEDWNN